MQLARQGDGETMRSRGGDWQKWWGRASEKKRKRTVIKCSKLSTDAYAKNPKDVPLS